MTTPKKPQKTPSQQINKMIGLYDGAELRPFQGRPGSMDAFDKPSLINGHRMPHKPMVGMTSNVSSYFYAK